MIHFKFYDRLTGKEMGSYDLQAGMPMSVVDDYCKQYDIDAVIESVSV